MNCEFKYAKNTLDIIGAIIYGILALLHFSFFIFILVNSTKINLFIPLILLVSVIWIALFILYLNIYLGHRNYLVIYDGKLFKDRGFILPKNKIELSNILYVRKVGDKIRIAIGERNELKINLNCLIVDDIEKLESILGSQI